MQSEEKNQSKKIVKVVGALIIDDDGRFLICQRPEHKKRGLLFEFPGGKVESGETDHKALKRELMEELGVASKPDEFFFELEHHYPDISIMLTIYKTKLLGEPQKIEHADLKWIYPTEIDNYQFCPADKDILEKIKSVYEESNSV